MFRQLTLLVAVPLSLTAQTPQQTPQTQQMGDTSMHSISLAEAIRLANDRNVSNIIASNSVRSANYSVRSARAQLIPQVLASAGQTKSYGDRVGQSNQIVSFIPAWSYNTGIQSSMTIFDAGKMFADIKTANANVIAAEAGVVNTEFSVSLQVKLAYNLILANKESEAAAQAQLEAANVQLQTSIAKVNAGAANVSDSLRGIVQVGTAQLALLTAQNASRTAAAALTRLVGTPYFVTAQLQDTVERPPQAIDSAQVLQLALDGPGIRQEQATIVANEAAIRSARTAYLPTVTAGFNLGGSGTSAIYGFNSNPFPYTRTINVSLNYPLFNRFTRENNIAAAQINLENTQATLKDDQLAAQQNILTAIATMRNAEETMRVQQINVEASQEDLRVQQQRYNLGASVLLDVLNSQLELVTARQQLIQARLNYRNARAQIESYIGRDLP
jgi:outer membrane protein